MSLNHEEKEIDGIRFSTTAYPAMRALELMGKLASTIGPALGALSMADNNTEMERFAPVLASALRDVKPEELSSLVISVLSGTSATITENGTLKRVDLNDRSVIDRVFSGKLLTMFKVVIHVLQVNYADFGFGSAPESAPQAPETK